MVEAAQVRMESEAGGARGWHPVRAIRTFGPSVGSSEVHFAEVNSCET
jgi:hypothetical protein